MPNRWKSSGPLVTEFIGHRNMKRWIDCEMQVISLLTAEMVLNTIQWFSTPKLSRCVLQFSCLSFKKSWKDVALQGHLENADRSFKMFGFQQTIWASVIAAWLGLQSQSCAVFEHWFVDAQMMTHTRHLDVKVLRQLLKLSGSLIVGTMKKSRCFLKLFFIKLN